MWFAPSIELPPHQSERGASQNLHHGAYLGNKTRNFRTHAIRLWISRRFCLDVAPYVYTSPSRVRHNAVIAWRPLRAKVDVFPPQKLTEPYLESNSSHWIALRATRGVYLSVKRSSMDGQARSKDSSAPLRMKLLNEHDFKRPAPICRKHPLAEAVLLRWRREYEEREVAAFTLREVAAGVLNAERERFRGQLVLLRGDTWLAWRPRHDPRSIAGRVSDPRRSLWPVSRHSCRARPVRLPWR